VRQCAAVCGGAAVRQCALVRRCVVVGQCAAVRQCVAVRTAMCGSACSRVQQCVAVCGSAGGSVWQCALRIILHKVAHNIRSILVCPYRGGGTELHVLICPKGR
jgi:hypothetical protein